LLSFPFWERGRPNLSVISDRIPKSCSTIESENSHRVKGRWRRGVAWLTSSILGLFLALSAVAAAPERLILGQMNDPTTLNPLYIIGTMDLEVGGLLYSRLFTFDEEGRIVPEVAQSVPTIANKGISSDGLTITYHLRRNVRWSDGQPLTSKDILFTHAAVMNPRNAVPIQYGDDEIKSISAPDAYTIRVRLRERNAAFVSSFDRNILPEHLLSNAGPLNKAEFNAQPIGSGPYRLSKWIRGDRLIFDRNEAYWGPRPDIPQIIVRIIPNQATILVQLQSGEIDAAMSVDPSNLNAIKRLPEKQIILKPTRTAIVMVFNTRNSLFHDVVLRQAVSLAINREAFIREAGLDFLDPKGGLSAIFGWAADPKIQEPAFDPVKANRILDADGWRRGNDGIRVKNGQRLSITLDTHADSPFLTKMANLIQQALRETGIDSTTKTYNVAQLFSFGALGPIHSGHFDMLLSAFAAEPDPDPTWLLGCKGDKPVPYNFAAFCDPSIERDLQKGRSSYDVTTRLRAYSSVERRTIDTAPIVFLAQTKDISAIPVALRGVNPSPSFGPYWNVGLWTF